MQESMAVGSGADALGLSFCRADMQETMAVGSDADV